METPEAIPAAPMSLDDYLVAVSKFDELFETLPQDEDHGFYIYMTHEYPQWQDIDGASLLELYEKNVVEGDMEDYVFYEYCWNHDFPCPIDKDGNDSQAFTMYTGYKRRLEEVRAENYREWAEDNGIKTTKGAVMQFSDAEGKIYQVKTDPLFKGTPLP